MTMAQRKATPWDITIEIQPLNPDDEYELLLDHHSIDVEVPNPEQLGRSKVTLDETTTAYRWAAGILARLGLALYDEVVDATRGHGCPRGDRCGLKLIQPDMIRILESGDGPRLAVTIPAGCDLDDWTDTVRTRLEVVLEHEQWQPTDDERTSWEAE
jgi:hypothetical protein